MLVRDEVRRVGDEARPLIAVRLELRGRHRRVLEPVRPSVKFSDGNPYGTSHHAVFGPDLGSIDDDTRNAARHQAERVVWIARALKQGSAV